MGPQGDSARLVCLLRKLMGVLLHSILILVASCRVVCRGWKGVVGACVRGSAVQGMVAACMQGSKESWGVLLV